MHRHPFEAICDAIAGAQGSIGELTQWAVCAAMLGGAATVLARAVLGA